MKRIAFLWTAACLALGTGFAVECAAAAPDAMQRVGELKKQLQASQAALLRYEWIETTVIAKGGDEKSRQQNRCYYGADGILQKLPLASTTESKAGGPPGILPMGKLMKKFGEHKKEELRDYLERATALAHSYIPPQAERIQQAINAGKLEVRVKQPGRQLELVFRDYRKPGDVLRIDMDVTANRLLGMHVSSYLDERDETIEFDVAMSALADGTTYAAKTTLAAKAKDIVVTIENTGYRRAAG